MPLTYLDFDVEIVQKDGQRYAVAVRSHAGQARQTVAFPFTDAELETHLLKVENALLRSVGQRRTVLTPEEDAVRTFGQQLFDFLLSGELRSLYYECHREANHQGKGVRVKLNVQPPLLAALPWEFLFDPRKRDYVCLDPNTPLVRYTDLPQTALPLPVTLPLRILGMVAAPTDLPRLDVAQEQARVTQAVQPLQARGLVELTWLAGQTWRDLQQIMRPGYGPWHIFHFIGHGMFDAGRDEGRLALADDQGPGTCVTCEPGSGFTVQVVRGVPARFCPTICLSGRTCPALLACSSGWSQRILQARRQVPGTGATGSRRVL